MTKKSEILAKLQNKACGPDNIGNTIVKKPASSFKITAYGIPSCFEQRDLTTIILKNERSNADFQRRKPSND